MLSLNQIRTHVSATLSRLRRQLAARSEVGRRALHEQVIPAAHRGRQAAFERLAYRHQALVAGRRRAQHVIVSRLPVAPRLDNIGTGWRRFAGRRYRALHGISAGQALVGSLVGDALYIPLLLGIGVDAAVVTSLAALPFLGALSQRAVPRLLDRYDGNLRGLTVFAALLGETRGFAMALIAVLAALGLHPVLVTVLVALVVGLGQTLGAISGANLQAWYAIVVPEAERRFAAPRMTAMTATMATLILLPVGIYLELVLPLIGEWAYVPLFVVSGAAGLLIAASMRAMPHPGRVRVPRAALESGETLESGQLRRFRRAAAIHAGAIGIQPYVSIYLIAVLGMSAGFTVLLASLAAFTNLLGSTLASSFLQNHSSSRLLRATFVVRATTMGLCVLAFPGNPLAMPILVLMTVANSLAGSAGGLAATERFFRLASGPATIRHQGHYIAVTSAAQAGGQLTMAAIIGIVPGASYLVFGALFAASGLGRLYAARCTEVSPSWRSPAPSHSRHNDGRATAGA